MEKIELAVNTDFHGESTRLEDVEALLAKIAGAGFTHVHWCHEWEGDYIYSYWEMEQIREWMEKYHLKAKALHATKGSRRFLNEREGHYRKDYTSDWEWNRKAGVELIKNRVEMAACLGASEIVLHLYVPFLSIEKGEMKAEGFYENVEKSMNELQPFCQEKGVRICLENLFDMPAKYMIQQWDWVLEKYPKDFLGFCLDVGHANLIWREKLPEVIRRYGERIYAVHLHDNYGAMDEHMIPGNGNIPWEETMRALAESSYELPLLLELGDCRGDEEAYLEQGYKAGLWLDKLMKNRV